MIVRGLGAFGFGRRHILAQETPHDGIQDTREFWPPQQPRRFYGLRHDCMIGNAGIGELVKPYREQRVDHAVLALQRTIQELRDPGLQGPVAPQRPVAKQPQQRAIFLPHPGFVGREGGIE